MAIYCHQCGQQREFPFSSMRTEHSPCQFCGGFDEVEAVGRLTSKPKRVKLLNYSYPDRLLPGTSSDVNKQADKEYEQTD